MVDEVAWGVGWGSAGDDATPEAELLEAAGHGASSKSEDTDPEPYQAAADALLNDDDDEEDWRQEERIARPAMEAATRRSSSRVQRSLSRAPIPTRTPGSGRSMSRHSRASSPPPSSRSVSFFGMDSQTHSASHSPMCSPYYETPSSRSRSASRPRGRRPTKNHSYFPSPSRSPSPSAVPATPLDLGSHILARMHLEDHPEELELEPVPIQRGRSLYAPTYQDDDLHDDAVVYGPASHDVVSQDDSKLVNSTPSVAAQWTSAFFSGFRQGQRDEASRSLCSDESSRDRSCSSSGIGVDEDDDEDHAFPNRNTLPRISRPGSTPPTWDTGVSAKSEGLVTTLRPSQDYFLLGSGALSGSGTPGPTLISRSRSADVQQTAPKTPLTIEIPTPSSS